MSSGSQAIASSATRRAGIAVALLQLALALSWTAYVVYLPKLAASVGIAPSTVIVILMMDQAIFTVFDTVMGIAADRIRAWLGRFGPAMAGLTLASCACFCALPYVASLGPAAAPSFVALIVLWAATSSALRAPPLSLLGRYGARPALPLLAALVMLGYGVAGAAAPYLGIVLRDVDPRLPFACASIVLAAVTLTLAWIERGLVPVSLRVSAEAPEPPAPSASAVALVGSTLVLALGFQVYANFNTAPAYLRFAKQTDLPWLLPVFWIGFNLALFAASAAIRKRGAWLIMAVAGLVGGGAAAAGEYSSALHVFMATQFLSGAAWGCMLTGAFSAALALGGAGASGHLTGIIFSSLALATLARMAAVAGGLQKLPEYTALLRWTPVVCWLAAGCGLLLVGAAFRRRRAAAR